MYPLVVIFGIGFLRNDRGAFLYGISLAAAGWLIAVYHNLLYYNILPESAAPCRQGISCTAITIQWLGFITIPLLSLVAFALILGLSFFTLRSSHHE